MRYFDASALAKRYLEESESATLRAMLDAPSCTSRLAEVEVASALVRRAREGSLEPGERDLDEMLLIELTPAITGAARRILGRHALRAPDAIHLASCLDLRFELGADIPFVVFDARLREAAVAEGLQVEP